MSTIISRILNNKCPNCDSGKVYNEKSILFQFSFPKMNDKCSNCGFLFQKEPGFFFGAMYVNYGLTVAEAIATYVISQFFFEQRFDLLIIPIIAFVIIVLTPFNLRFSRLTWIYMFKNYSRQYSSLQTRFISRISYLTMFCILLYCRKLPK